HRSETQMLRYLRRLADKDLALDRAMIPLGSCTMKLNATSEMLPVTWPEFGALHPFAPADQAQGYVELIRDLEQMLCAVTGYDAVSLQPNAGSQGEYAGLLMIHAYHASRGEAHRDLCLIPASAHGTNPASAQMAGMRVVVVACDRDGNVDLTDLRAKAQAHCADLAAIMVTYPSTHGVFEAGIREACDIVHACGGRADWAGVRRTQWQRGHPAHFVDVHRDDGKRRIESRHRIGDPCGELHREAAFAALSRALLGSRRARRARMHHRSARAQGDERR